HASGEPALRLHRYVQRLEADQIRLHCHFHGEWIVEEDAPLVPRLPELEAEEREVLEEAGAGGPDTGGGALEDPTTQHDLACDAEGQEIDGQARREDDGRGVGVNVHVELGHRGDVAAGGDRPAHDHDARAAGEGFRIALEGQGEVAQGPEGDEDELVGKFFDGLENQIRGVERLKEAKGLAVAWSAARLLKALEIAKAVRPVDVGGGDKRLTEGYRGSLGHPRPTRGSQDVEDPEDVLRAEAHLDVAGHGGDGFHGQLGGAEGNKDGERVVDAGVGVDEEGGRQLTLPGRIRIMGGGGQTQ